MKDAVQIIDTEKCLEIFLRNIFNLSFFSNSENPDNLKGQMIWLIQFLASKKVKSKYM